MHTARVYVAVGDPLVTLRAASLLWVVEGSERPVAVPQQDGWKA